MTAKSIAYFLGYPATGLVVGLLLGQLISYLPARWEIPALVAANLALVVVTLVLALCGVGPAYGPRVQGTTSGAGPTGTGSDTAGTPAEEEQ